MQRGQIVFWGVVFVLACLLVPVGMVSATSGDHASEGGMVSPEQASDLSGAGVADLAEVRVAHSLAGGHNEQPPDDQLSDIETQDPAAVHVADDLEESDGTADVLVGFEEPGPSATVADRQSHASDVQTPLAELADIRDGLTVDRRFWLVNAALVSVETDRLDPATLARVDGVERIEPNAEVTAGADAVTAPPAVSERGAHPGPSSNGSAVNPPRTYGLDQIGAPTAWEQFGTRGEESSVAVLDTGVDPTHPDIDLAGWAEFDRDGTPVDSPPQDYDSHREPGGHGTHVSGTVVGGAASGTQIGVAPAADLYHAAVLTDCSTESCVGSTTQVIAGMEWAVQQDVDVLSMSLGGFGPRPAYVEAVRNARTLGTTVVASIGNDGEGTSGMPGMAFDSIGVGASDADGGVISLSSGRLLSTDRTWDTVPPDWPEQFVVPAVAAPGSFVTSAVPGDGYAEQTGTSMAAPHVSGAVALLQSATEERLSPGEVQTFLEETAAKPDEWGRPADRRDARYGAGIIDVPAAIAATEALPVASITPDAVVVEPGETVAFEASRTVGAVHTYEWDLTGDGTVDATGERVSTTFATEGTATVTLNVTAVDGSTDETTTTVSIADPPVPTDWATEVGEAVFSSPTIVGDTVFVGSGGIGSEEMGIHALDATSGENRWSHATDSRVRTAPTVSDGRVIATQRDGTVLALDAVTGEEVWTVEFTGLRPTSPTIAPIAPPEGQTDSDGLVVVASGGLSEPGTVTAVDARTGDVIWEVETAWGSEGAPVVVPDGWNATVAGSGGQEADQELASNGTVYVTTENGTVQALSATTGDTEWTAELGPATVTSPTVAGETVVVGATPDGGEDGESSGAVFAIDRTDGEVIWDRTLADEVAVSVTAYPGADGATGTHPTTLFATEDGTVTALNATAGQTRWETDIGHGPGAAPTVAGDRIYIPDSDGMIHALDSESGETVWTHGVATIADSAPTVADGQLFLGTGAGVVHAFDLETPQGSVDTRVLLGTLGHHEAWANTPTALLRVDADAGPEGGPIVAEQVSLDGTVSSGDIEQYEWDLTGDGATDATGPTIEYTFDEPGDIPVTLTVTDDEGVTDETTRTIRVNETVQQWQLDTGGPVGLSSPTVVDLGTGGSVDSASEPTGEAGSATGPTVFVGSENGTVTAANATSGERIWAFATDGPVTASPTVVDLQPTDTDAGASTVDATTASRASGDAMTSGTGVTADSAGLTTDGWTVVTGSHDGSIYALDARTGSPFWEFATDGQVRSSPTVSGTTVYVGSSDGTVSALELATGETVWSFEADGPVRSSPVVHDSDGRETVLVGSTEGTVYALDARDGTERWNAPTGGAVIGAPAVANETVFAGSLDEFVHALNLTTGETVWQYETDAAVWSSPTVALQNGQETVFVGSSDDGVYALDADSGERVWRTETAASVRSSPTVAPRTPGDESATASEASGWDATANETGGDTILAGHVVFVGSQDGTVHALNATDGTETDWTFQTEDAVVSSPVVVDTAGDGDDSDDSNATLYVGSDDGSLYALDAGADGAGADGGSVGTRVRSGGLGHHGAWADQTPVAVVAADPRFPDPGEEVHLDASGSVGQINDIAWDLTGDGETDETGAETTIVQDDPTALDITVTVTDETGATDTRHRTILVDPGPPPVVGTTLPQDLTGDGLYEDVRGDGDLTVYDVQALFTNLDSDVVQDNPAAFGFHDQTAPVSVFDAQALFASIGDVTVPDATATSLDGFASIDEPTEEWARANALDFPPLEPDSDPMVVTAAVTDGEWESVDIEIPPPDPSGLLPEDAENIDIEATLSAPDGLGGQVDPDAGEFTLAGTLRAEVTAMGLQFDLDIPIDATAGDSSALSGSFAEADDSYEVTVVDNEFVVADQTGVDLVDDLLGLPSTEPGTNWFELDLVLEGDLDGDQ